TGRTNMSARKPPGPSHGCSPRRSSATKSPRHTTSFHFKRRKRFGTLACAGAFGSPVGRLGLAVKFMILVRSHLIRRRVVNRARRSVPDRSFTRHLVRRRLVSKANTLE